MLLSCGCSCWWKDEGGFKIIALEFFWQLKFEFKLAVTFA